MRKLSALVALLAVLAVGGIAASAADKQKVKSKVSLRFDAAPGSDAYYEEAAFTGTVATRGRASKKAKRVCRKGRTVVINQLGAGSFGRVKTDQRGRYALSASDAYNAPGRYSATVRKRKRGKIVCRKATSKPVEAF